MLPSLNVMKPSASAKKAKFNPKDRTYNEVKHILERKNFTVKSAKEAVVREAYVDVYRNTAFNEVSDLKGIMKEKGMTTGNVADYSPGDPNDEMYLRQAEHLMKRGVYSQAIIYLHQSLQMNPESKHAMTSLARCYLYMGQWEFAKMSAEFVLEMDKSFVKAIYPKAEALYNTCQFEHALVLFHRGKRLSPDMEEFRLGVQKCKKTIQNSVGSPNVFKVKGARIIFRILRRLADMRTANDFFATMKKKSQVAEEDPLDKLGGVTPGALTVNLTGLTGIMERKKRDAKAAKGNIHRRWGKPIEVMKDCEDDGMTESERRQLVVAERCRAKAKKFASADRLLQDKDYLVSLSRGIGHRPDVEEDAVEKDIAVTAYEALDFLRSREKFWKQIQLGETAGSLAKRNNHKRK